jgi:formiminotetrahydrofolate cyclodeaminase
MGLKSAEGLREFCFELSDDKPSPGGGTAAAAAGAMGASLFIMVCGLTRKKKAYAEHLSELQTMEEELMSLRNALLRLSAEDALAYDKVVEATRRRKESDTPEASKEYDDAVREATEVPRRTATACMRLLEIAPRLAEIGSRAASSDTGVGIRLAEVGVRGAAMNILINLKSSQDPAYVRAAGEELMARGERADTLMIEALSVLESLQK